MNTSTEKDDNSLRNFPPDLVPTLIMPFMAIVMIFSRTVFSARGTAWIWAAAVSFGLAAIGITLLFIAKWPLYRQRRFFTFGIHHLPSSSHRFYRWGCRLSILACVLMFLLWLASIFPF
jgi:hypothetical protein